MTTRWLFGDQLGPHFVDDHRGPLLSSSENYERWMRGGGHDANHRAQVAYQKTLEDYEQPPLDDDSSGR